ncbi:MAG: transglycosylase [Chthoniobacteraceae bacterium]|nr:transglycosylase [Chthoniobacteraceae bacterium]
MLAVIAIVCVVYGIWASTFDMEAVKEMPQRSTVYDMDGKVYSRLQGENRIVVPVAQVSRNFINALLAREDSRFYWHKGIDPIGITRAVVRNVFKGATAQGASTLTQQLARNSFPERVGQHKSLHRKLLEAFLSIRIEQRYKKEEILEHYVNRIYFGAGVYGIEAASLMYFNHHAAELTQGEAAMIAGIIRSPNRFSPFTNPKGARRERDTVLDRLVKAEKLMQAEADDLKKEPLIVAKKRLLTAQENYAMDAVRRELDLLLSDDQRDDGGLKVYTTLDPGLQSAAEKAIDFQLRKVEARPGYHHPKKADFSKEAKEEELQTPYLQGAVVVIDNRTGGIRALVGGRDFSESKYNRAILPQAARQVGSTFKPFVYATAFSRGMLPGASISDGPLERGEIEGAAGWTPENSDGTYKGSMRAEEGLIQSRNTMSVRIGDRAGLEPVSKFAESVGIQHLPRQPAEYLGAFESTVADVTAAYTVFPNNGVRRQSFLIERIDDASGEIIYRSAHISAPVLDPGVSYLINNVLGKVMERGTGATVKTMGFNKPSAGKTGTTNDFHDAWFVGYTTSLTCGVWVGLDRPQTIISKGYGAAVALPIWADVMNSAMPQRYPAAAFKPPSPLQRTQVCSISNETATGACERAGTAYSIELPASVVPHDSCHVHRGGGNSNDSRNDSNGDTSRRPVNEGILRSFRRFFGGK